MNTPTNQRRTTRAARAAAALSGAAMLIAVLLAFGASPASADTCWQNDDGSITCTYDGGTIFGDDPGGTGGAGGGGGGGRYRPLEGDPQPVERGGVSVAEQALDTEVAMLVDQKLADLNCRALITGVAPAGGDDAQAVFEAVRIVRSPTPRQDEPDAAADATFMGGVNGTMTLYPPFDEYNGGDILGFLPAQTTLSRTPSRDEFKAMHVLHELAHLTGALTPHADDNSDSEVFNQQILNRCFGITSTTS